MSNVKNILARVENFRLKTAAHAHYSTIIELYRAIQDISAVVKVAETPQKIDDLSNNLNYLVRRLVYNADLYGLSAQTSSKYGNKIKQGLDRLTQYARDIDNDAILSMADNAREIMRAYRPQNLPAQRPDAKTKSESKPSQKPAQSQQSPLAQTEQQMQAEKGIYPGGVVGVPAERTMPGPSGERMPMPKNTPQQGVAREKETEYSFGPRKPSGPARLAPEFKLPENKQYPGPGESL